jgi:hypothetical protein
MTNTVKQLRSVRPDMPQTDSALPGWPLLLRESGESLVEQIVRGIRAASMTSSAQRRAHALDPAVCRCQRDLALYGGGGL